MKITIRQAKADDLDQVYGLICELEGFEMDKKIFEETYFKNSISDGISYWVIAHEKIMVGFVSLHIQQLLHHSKKVAEVQELCVAANYRGNGFGKLLLDQAILEARNQHCELIELAANKKRVDAHRFYEREGWERSHFKFTMKL